ncbi:SMN family protein Smn1 [Schizosaccharomyces pombe]
MDQSQKEVWDDSELRNAFETALHEFKKYHSIEAKGGVSDPDSRLDGEKLISAARTEESISKLEEGEQMINQQTETTLEGDTHIPQFADNKGLSDEKPETRAAETHQEFMEVPPPIRGLTYDETYKKLIMSWYYAGYYTGLAEGLAKSEQRKD